MFAQSHPYTRLQVNLPALVGAVHFVNVGEGHAFALGAHALARHVVQAQHHVL